MHEKCYRDYTRICTKQNATPNKNSASRSGIDESGDCKKRFENLSQFVRDRIVDGGQSVSIKLLTEVYGLDKEDCGLRGKVKQMLLREFNDELLFVTVSNNEVQVVLGKNVLTNATKDSFMTQNRDFVLKEATKVLKDDILALIQSVPDLPWPPTVDSLQSEGKTISRKLTNVSRNYYAPR